MKFDIYNGDRFFTGTDYSINFQIKQPDGTTAQNITGWGLSWMLKRRTKDPDTSAVLTKTTPAGITITNGPLGLCTVNVADTDTLLLLEGHYKHELKRTDDAFETVLCAGTAELLASAHRL